MKIEIPEFSLVVLIGVSGSGKSTFAKTHFKPTEIVSSDHCRALLSDSENDQAITPDAFELAHYLVGKRLKNMKLTVFDATNLQRDFRKPLLALAKQYHCMPVAIVLDTPRKLCEQRTESRPDRDFGLHVIRNQFGQLRRSIGNLKREGFRYVFTLKPPEDTEGLVITRRKLWSDRREDSGPFDIIGDIHGCYDELVLLLTKLGYTVDESALAKGEKAVQTPTNRRAAFLGDLVDRGPKSPEVLDLVMNMVSFGQAICVPGNHEVKLLNWMRGKKVKASYGLAETIEQLADRPESFKQDVSKFIDGLVSHLVLDGGRLVLAHAGMREDLQGRPSGKVRQFALYGETTGETDRYGLPVRYDWARDYRGKATVVYGHTPVPEAEWVNRTICLDTGCVFGGKLTALRFPERELVSVDALKVHYEPVKPLGASTEAASAQQSADRVLDIEGMLGPQRIATRLRGSVSVYEDQAAAAFEVINRFAVDPRWLIYLPPTMSPPETHKGDGLLEHPDEAFAYYRDHGISKVICQEKHMGSRAILVICRSAEAARQRFGVKGNRQGVIYSRTGRPFFTDKKLEGLTIARLVKAMEHAGWFDEFKSDWFCLDAEIMPWSLKAVSLLQSQYAATGSAGEHALTAAEKILQQAEASGSDVASLIEENHARQACLHDFRTAYRAYCRHFESIDDLRIAPFHILASEGSVHADRDHVWHMQTLRALCSADQKLLLATEFRETDLTDPESVAAAVAWWHKNTADQAEGMVVKPLDFIARGKGGLVQPAVKCRGFNYLRIIYGPEYSREENLVRLRKRGLRTKRMLALREFALGLQALEHFVNHKPLRDVHQCVLGVLALESQPVDPRL